MDLAFAIAEQASRLGLELQWDAPNLRVTRDDWSLDFNAEPWLSDKSDKNAFLPLAWLLQGIRFGLDKHIPAPEPEVPLHLRFRRAQLRRYQEAPSFHGDHLPLLVPEITALAFEKISGQKAFRRPWSIPGYQILIYEDIGRRREILTVGEQEKADESNEDRWQKVRTALFYDAYKLRPRERRPVDGGELRIFESTDGMGGTRGLLLPEFDYDSARDGGFFAIPSRDCFIIASPKSPQGAQKMLPGLLEAVDTALQNADFPLSDAIFELHPTDISIYQDPSLDFRRFTPILLAGLEQTHIISA